MHFLLPSSWKGLREFVEREEPWTRQRGLGSGRGSLGFLNPIPKILRELGEYPVASQLWCPCRIVPWEG